MRKLTTHYRGGARTPRVTTILITFLVVSALASPLLGVVQNGTGLDPTILQLTQFSTAVGAFAAWMRWRGRRPYPPTTRRSVLRPVALGAAMALAITFVLIVLARLGPDHWRAVDLATLPAPLALILCVQLIGAAGEEVGWRGLVQPLMETRMPTTPAAAITGLFFGLGHFYVLSMGIAVYVVFVVSTIGLSLAAAAITTGRSWTTRVVASTTLHWGVNVGILVGFGNGDDSLQWIVNTMIAMSVVGAACVPWLIRSSRHLPETSFEDRVQGVPGRLGHRRIRVDVVVQRANRLDDGPAASTLPGRVVDAERFPEHVAGTWR